MVVGYRMSDSWSDYPLPVRALTEGFAADNFKRSWTIVNTYKTIGEMPKYIFFPMQNLISCLFTFSDTITGMSLSPDGAHILTNSMDNTLRLFDIRPFAKNDRCLKLFTGHLHNFEKVS